MNAEHDMRRLMTGAPQPRPARGLRFFCAASGFVWGLVLLLSLLLAQPGQAAEGGTKINLFGTVEFKRPLNTLPDWLEVMKRNEQNPIFTPGSKLNANTTWDELKAKAEKLSPLEQLKLVNSFWNQWPYRTDMEVYHKEDYWAAPYEFRKNSGDCEDYSIVKYYTLRALGVPIDNMRIVILMETIRNVVHAVLVVYLDGDAYVLDNLSSNVLSHTRYRNYVPQYSLNEHDRWAHIKPKK